MTYTTLVTRPLSTRAKFWSTVNVLTAIDAAMLAKVIQTAVVEIREETTEAEETAVDVVVRTLKVVKVQEPLEKTTEVVETITRVKRIKGLRLRVATNQQLKIAAAEVAVVEKTEDHVSLVIQTHPHVSKTRNAPQLLKVVKVDAPATTGPDKTKETATATAKTDPLAMKTNQPLKSSKEMTHKHSEEEIEQGHPIRVSSRCKTETISRDLLAGVVVENLPISLDPQMTATTTTDKDKDIQETTGQSSMSTPESNAHQENVEVPPVITTEEEVATVEIEEVLAIVAIAEVPIATELHATKTGEPEVAETQVLTTSDLRP